MRMKTSHLLFVCFVSLALLGYVVYLFEWSRYVHPSSVRHLIDGTGPYLPIVFVFAYFTVLLLLLSLTSLSVVAGIVLGSLWGSIYVVIVATLAAQMIFHFARGNKGANFLYPQKDSGALHTVVYHIQKNLEKSGFRKLLIMRCLYFPYIPFSYAAGLVPEVRSKEFFLSTFISNCIFVPSFVYFGDSLLKGPRAIIVPVLLIGLVLSGSKLLEIYKAKYS